MNDDPELLRRYAGEGSQPAFAELVRRHVDLVYGAAWRRTGDPHRAAEVAQQVFISLARDARKLSRHTVLAAWLHTATRNAAINLMISEQRRREREARALALETAPLAADGEPRWEQLRPLLDEAIDELPEADRAAVALRFLERKPFAEIGGALRVTEDAARVRTGRALDKLRDALARRGITSTATALGALVAAQSDAAAPAGLASTLTAQAMSAANAGALTFMTTKLVLTALLSAAVAFGAGLYVSSYRQADAVAVAKTETEASARRDQAHLTQELAAATSDLSALRDSNAKLAAQMAEAAKPRKNPTVGLARWEVQDTILNNLRQIEAARQQYKLEHGHTPDTLAPLVGRGQYIKAVRTVGGEDYSNVSMVDGAPLTVTTPDGTTVTYDPSGATTTHPDYPPEMTRYRELDAKVKPTIQTAVAAYRAAHDGKNPPTLNAVLPYFSTPQEGADFAEYVELQKSVGP